MPFFILHLSNNLIFQKEATMPSITVCNLNQIEASYLKKTGFYDKNLTIKAELDESKQRCEALAKEVENSKNVSIVLTYPL